MYLYILEDGEMLKSLRCDDDDKAMCENGLIDIIDLHAENPKQYFRGEWHSIDTHDKESEDK